MIDLVRIIHNKKEDYCPNCGKDTQGCNCEDPNS